MAMVIPATRMMMVAVIVVSFHATGHTGGEEKKHYDGCESFHGGTFIYTI